LSRPRFQISVECAPMNDRPRSALRAMVDLDEIPSRRRWLVGLGALISVVPAAFFGVAFIVAPARNVPLMLLKTIELGPGLLCVAAFMFLVWLRLWFGKRQWIDSTLQFLFPRAYIYLVLGICVLLIFGHIKSVCG
jgi:hypothetical protein